MKKLLFFSILTVAILPASHRPGIGKLFREAIANLKAGKPENFSDEQGNTTLMAALLTRYYNRATDLIDLYSTDMINKKNNRGQTALILIFHVRAITFEDKLFLIKHILQKKNIDINCQDHNGYTPLQNAVRLQQLYPDDPHIAIIIQQLEAYSPTSATSCPAHIDIFKYVIPAASDI